ncbi:hypothetical protein [Methylomonas koyamae]|uniref:hypothetical protein n=1 Tax=Methylomonas koyamae TaxID=702114 RepID=UPI00112E9728|nr:hypothetical protein [Methylomonas koyamae]TPQ24937.1 hypothetical protein C2U68_17315 [Methylomonas koyamae]
MPSTRDLRNSFNGGEVSRRLLGKTNLAKYQTGLETCLNFIPLPQGSAINRPGTLFVNVTRTPSRKARLIPFVFSTGQAFAIEMGVGYFRFHTLGGTLLDGSVPYQISSPYGEDDIFDIVISQSGDVITLTHPLYAVRELTRISNTHWTLTTVGFSSQTAAPTGVSAVATYATAGNPKTVTYKVTALNSRGYEESVGSAASGNATNDLTISGNYNTVTWSAVTGAAMYNVYKSAAGGYGYIGQTSSLSFVDDNILADMSHTLPISEDPFNGTDNYPSAVGYFEQRRFFGGTNNDPMNVWSTQSGSDYNMNYTIPSQDSDALRFKIKAYRSDVIRHIVPLQDLVILTAANEWRIAQAQNGALVPSTINPKPQGQNGASKVQPELIGNRMLYVAARGGHLLEMSYDWQNNGYISQDVSILATHLFDYLDVVDMAFASAPWKVLWCVSSNGQLLGCTYVPEQDVLAWHRHQTDGEVESCCVIPENNADVLYLIVKRIINGETKRYVEMLDLRNPATAADAFFVDSGLTYSGAATNVISGLEHLEGKTVAILGNGQVMTPKVVTGGQITLDDGVTVTKAQIGLPITADLKTLPLWFQDSTQGQSRIKNVNKVWAQILNSAPFYAGPDFDQLTPIKTQTLAAMATPGQWYSGLVELVVKADWNSTGQTAIRHTDPTPLEIVFIASEVAIGG